MVLFGQLLDRRESYALLYTKMRQTWLLGGLLLCRCNGREKGHCYGHWHQKRGAFLSILCCTISVVAKPASNGMVIPFYCFDSRLFLFFLSLSYVTCLEFPTTIQYF